MGQRIRRVRAAHVLRARPPVVARDQLAAVSVGARTGHVATIRRRAQVPIGAQDRLAGAVALTAGVAAAAVGRAGGRRILAGPELAARAKADGADTCAARLAVVRCGAIERRAMDGRKGTGVRPAIRARDAALDGPRGTAFGGGTARIERRRGGRVCARAHRLASAPTCAAVTARAAGDAHPTTARAAATSTRAACPGAARQASAAARLARDAGGGATLTGPGPAAAQAAGHAARAGDPRARRSRTAGHSHGPDRGAAHRQLPRAGQAARRKPGRRCHGRKHGSPALCNRRAAPVDRANAPTWPPCRASRRPDRDNPVTAPQIHREARATGPRARAPFAGARVRRLVCGPGQGIGVVLGGMAWGAGSFVGTSVAVFETPSGAAGVPPGMAPHTMRSPPPPSGFGASA